MRVLVVMLVMFFSQMPLYAASVKVAYEKGASGEPSAMKSEGVIQGSPEALWQAIVRINDWGRFMPKMPVSFYVSEEGAQAIRQAPTRNANRLTGIAERYRVEVPRSPGGKWEGTVFQVVDLPFPIENRWFLLKYTNDETKAAEHRYQQCWEMIAANVNEVHGCFRVSPEGEGNSHLSYEEISDLGGHVPEWVVKIGVRHTTPDVFLNLQKEIARIR